MTVKQKRYGIDVIGIYFEQTKRFPSLSSEQESNLVEKARKDEKAKEKLLMHTLWVVPAIANEFIEYELEYIDLIGEGNYGLIKAINSLDKFRGESRFSTYAGGIIKHAISDALRKEKRQPKLKKEDEQEQFNYKNQNPLDVAEKNESLENLEQAVKNLSPAEKSLLKDLFVEDKNVNEMANSNNGKKSFLYRKRERIFEKLRRAMAA